MNSHFQVSVIVVLPEGVLGTGGRCGPFGRWCHGALVLLAQCIDGRVIIWSGCSTGLGGGLVADRLHARTKAEANLKSLTDALRSNNGYNMMILSFCICFLPRARVVAQLKHVRIILSQDGDGVTLLPDDQSRLLLICIAKVDSIKLKTGAII